MLNPGQVDVQYESYSPGFRLTRGKQSVCEKGLNYPRSTLNLGLNKAKVGVGPLCPMLRELTAVYNYVLHTTQCFLGVRVVRLFMHLQASLHSSQMERGTECYGILKGFHRSTVARTVPHLYVALDKSICKIVAGMRIHFSAL